MQTSVQTAAPVRQAPTAQEKKEHPASTCRLWLDITDSQGVSNRYVIKPEQAQEDEVYRYRLTRRATAERPEKTYHAGLMDTGEVFCTCLAHQKGMKCKHKSCLQAVGLIRQDVAEGLQQLDGLKRLAADEADKGRKAQQEAAEAVARAQEARTAEAREAERVIRQADYQPDQVVSYHTAEGAGPVKMKVVKVSENRARVMLIPESGGRKRWVNAANVSPF
jgi:hypothetical protein